MLDRPAFPLQYLVHPVLLTLALPRVSLRGESLMLLYCAALRQLRPAASDLGNGRSTQEPPQPDPRVIQTTYWEKPQDSSPEAKAPLKPALTAGIINKVCVSKACWLKFGL